MDHTQRIQRLQAARGPYARELGIGSMVAGVSREASRVQREMGSLIEAWLETVPPELAGRTRVETVRRGVVNVAADSPAAAFELDRELRSGLLAALRSSYSGPITRVKVRVAPGVDRR